MASWKPEPDPFPAEPPTRPSTPSSLYPRPSDAPYRRASPMPSMYSQRPATRPTSSPSIGPELSRYLDAIEKLAPPRPSVIDPWHVAILRFLGLR